MASAARPVKSPIAAACVPTACRQLTSFRCLVAPLETEKEAWLPSFGVMKVPGRAFPESELKRCHVCVLAAAGLTRAVLSPKPVCVRAEPTGCVLRMQSVASRELLRPWFAAGSPCSRALASFVERYVFGRCADERFAQSAVEGVELGKTLS